MRTIAISPHECSELLKHLYIRRLGCALDNQPHIVPVYFSVPLLSGMFGYDLVPEEVPMHGS
jgi:hypothetical protein